MRRQITKAAKRDGIADIIRSAIKTNGGSSTVERLFGYTIADLSKHLESMFVGDMNWDRFKAGEIHIDHIKPQSTFNLQNNRKFRICWSLCNLQPLWAADNLKKSNMFYDIK
jgi:hypothetical protein